MECENPKITKSKYFKIPPNCFEGALNLSTIFLFVRQKWERGKEVSHRTWLLSVLIAPRPDGICKFTYWSWFQFMSLWRNGHENDPTSWQCADQPHAAWGTLPQWREPAWTWEKTKYNPITSWSGILEFFLSTFIYSTGFDTKKNFWLLFSEEFEWI